MFNLGNLVSCISPRQVKFVNKYDGHGVRNSDHGYILFRKYDIQHILSEQLALNGIKRLITVCFEPKRVAYFYSVYDGGIMDILISLSCWCRIHHQMLSVTKIFMCEYIRFLNVYKHQSTQCVRELKCSGLQEYIEYFVVCGNKSLIKRFARLLLRDEKFDDGDEDFLLQTAIEANNTFVKCNEDCITDEQKILDTSIINYAITECCNTIKNQNSH